MFVELLRTVKWWSKSVLGCQYMLNIVITIVGQGIVAFIPKKVIAKRKYRKISCSLFIVIEGLQLAK